MSALDDIAAERIRQLDEKGHDAEYDDASDHGELALAAATYATPISERPGPEDRPYTWLLPTPYKPAAYEGFDGHPTLEDRRVELVKAGALLAAEIDRLDRARAGVPQAYLPKVVCWDRRPIQCAIAVRVEVLEFCQRHPNLRVFSGLRIGSTGDHRCGYATDLVPLDYSNKGDVVNAFTDAELMRKRGKVAYVEPLVDTWIPGNHHLHVSWKRCP